MFYRVTKDINEELTDEINRINIKRGIITSSTFMIIQALMLFFLCLVKGKQSFEKPAYYYTLLYFIMFIGMTFFLIAFKKIDKNVPLYRKQIRFYGIAFASFILIWCALISLLDQHSTGQIIVYTVAILAVAVTPIYEPLYLLFQYTTVQIIFLILLFHFQKTGDGFWGNAINSTTFIIISWAISIMRYKKQVEDFTLKKIIEEKNEELYRINKELEKLSQTDGLTKVYNRFMFDKRVKEEWQMCKKGAMPLSLILIDIDNFKKINDNYGHQVGDECIRKVAEILSSSINTASDFLARYGGDEFAILLVSMEHKEIAVFLEQLRKNVEQRAIFQAEPSCSKYVTISLGACSVIPSDFSSIDEFIKAADNALYEAKKQRNTTVIV